jgi:hypothetical protein
VTYQPENLTRWTMPDHYAGAEWPDYFGAGTGQHRDSDALTRSNFRVMLKALGGESDTVRVVREGHWAVGWVEWIAIHESDAKSLEIADELKASLEDYPVLSDDDFSELEMEEANEVWANCYDAAERVAYIRKFRSQFQFHDFGDLLGCVRGKYFAGYASELLA